MVLRTIDNFLNKEECKQIIELIDQKNHKSTVANQDYTGYEEGSRNSSTSFLDPNNELVKDILKRIGQELNLDIKLAEGIQGQLYEPGQYFKPHHDWFSGLDLEKHCKHTGNRTHTLMIYLNEGFEGGKTDFPNIQFTAEPKTGRAVTWNNLKKDGSGDPDALHEGQTVTKGKKYIITSWWRTGIPLEPTSEIKTIGKTFSNQDNFPKFTEKGFKVVKVPEDAYALVQEMWEDVKKLGDKIEDFPGKEHIITGNSKTSNLYDLGQVSEKRDKLHDMLLPMHEEFSGEKLSKAWIYGIREYLQAADLKQHVDRIETHHISSIILVDKDLTCGCKHKEFGNDWALDIQAHDGTWEKVYLQPGEMILYESAKCSHGRDSRFEGKYYRNLFVHYTLQDWQKI